MSNSGGRRRRGLRAGVIAAIAAAIAAAAAVALSDKISGSPTRPAPSDEARPTLMLLTSLPIVFGEQFSLDQLGSPALKALEQRFRVVPISLADAANLGDGRLLLMAHPLAQPAEALVELDEWVRSGGRLLLLADPALDWHSDRPLGDRHRPPPMFADTGLLRHWGVVLEAPEERGPRLGELGGLPILTVSPGILSGRCPVSRDRLVARCIVGEGRATIVADADFLNIEDLDGPTQHNLDALVEELAAISQ
ncbi:MAG TPA: hypothetical protein VM346_11030 [Sphingomicrobium sp.]|nr:hypothetical protein [Sphingomicrobium sp.]